MSVFLEIDPDDWVGSNDLAFAINDRFPVSPGHTLVIPRRVVQEWSDVTTEEQHALFELVDVVKRRIDAELSPDGYNVGYNSGAAAGQTVPHLHVHVIPRFTGDMDDPRGGVRNVIPGRGNYLAPMASSRQATASPLVTPFDGRLKLELLRSLIRPDLDRVDLLVSFVMRSGINLIARHLDDALSRGARVRLLTTDYLQITDTSALGFFLDRLDSEAPGRLEARVFSDPTTSFHPKAYIFSSSTSTAGVAFVGSSNLSWSGITSGVEWNIELRDVEQLLREFEQLWADPRSIILTSTWLQSYDEIRQLRQAAIPHTSATAAPAPSSPEELADQAAADVETAPQPWSVQSEALAALTAARFDGHDAGLVVMATGLGKTWLAAFDSTRPEFRRVLFVAHREEILSQARDVYRQIRPSGKLTMFTGSEHEPDGDVVFASVQTLHRHLGRFAPDHFDYIVVDEFHHAAAATYRRVLAHFRPRFLLGLTATPDRADAADLLALCDDNLLYDCGLVDGIRRELLSPFRYRAIADVADYEHIPWRGGRFDADRLTAELATQERAQQVFDEWRHLDGAQRRALGFCCTIAHAEFMAEFFRENGVQAVAVHSGSTSAPRAESLERLGTSDLPVIFTVDLFNEGVDLPTVDLVLTLRPTESPVVFFQQLGRGLRRSDGKERLEVVDLVGNHRSFLLKARLLASLAGRFHFTDREAVSFLAQDRDALADGSPELPPGCSIVVDPEVIDLLGRLVGPPRSQDRLLDLARQWVDDHDGRRPTALELSLVTGQPFALKAAGGWFGFLHRNGLLTDRESRVVELAGSFLVWIEHGSYTKSYKLVTLGEMVRAARLRSGMPLVEVAAACRWAILRDSDLRADLNDAGSSFADLTSPTIEEWQAYWGKNPINALTGASRSEAPWFEIDASALLLRLDVPDELGDTFDALVTEIVEYRLHRYLVGQKARRVGESRKPRRDGAELDATFTVESSGGVPTSVVIESAGGSAGSPAARNTEYVDGLDLVLERLAAMGAQVLDVYIDTQSTLDLSLADRRLDPGEGLHYPLRLEELTDLGALRRRLLRSMSRAGRAPGSGGGGNARKRTRLVIAVDGDWSAAGLADALASGEWQVDQRSVARSDARPG
jgi:superfamily II DNA or RNA helicase/diadenosine tetraphosphate (Ap4A) HIT family hydrolase/HKD family nuclease